MSGEYDPLRAATPGAGLDHVPSYWAATARETADDDGPAPAQLDTEVAIIGGGYTGLPCACHLARHHGIQSVVLEAYRAGWGCSGRNGGFARMARAASAKIHAASPVTRWE